MAATEVIIDCSNGGSVKVQADTLLAVKPAAIGPTPNPYATLWQAVNNDLTVNANVKALLKALSGN